MQEVSRYFAKYVLREFAPHSARAYLPRSRHRATAEVAAHANLDRSYGVKLLSREHTFRHFGMKRESAGRDREDTRR